MTLITKNSKPNSKFLTRPPMSSRNLRNMSNRHTPPPTICFHWKSRTFSQWYERARPRGSNLLQNLETGSCYGTDPGLQIMPAFYLRVSGSHPQRPLLRVTCLERVFTLLTWFLNQRIIVTPPDRITLECYSFVTLLSEICKCILFSN